MATVKPFRCIRPAVEMAKDVAALPYDVYSREEAKEAVKGKPYSFLNIDRPETQFDPDFDMYSDEAYEKAASMLRDWQEKGVFVSDSDEAYYVYELIMNGRSQTGIVACAAVDDYLNNVIKKHENTREEKEIDRIRHVDTCNAQTGPIFLAYASESVIKAAVERAKEKAPLYSFTEEDGITHNVWKIAEAEEITKIRTAFEKINSIYIADGHHRAASAVKVGQKRRAENPGYTGNEEFNFFLSVLFPEDELMIMPYNRVVKDLNGLSAEEFLARIEENFDIKKCGSAVEPSEKGTFGMLLCDTWYLLSAKDSIKALGDPVKSLDVSVLQDNILSPVLGIKDPRTDKRIDFIGGIRGIKELERRVALDMKIAFSMYPTSIRELFAVSDAGLLMPPKSTWFEPKLRSGLFIHKIS
ncbi:MAG: DUF1015 domain-containing protein [Lachnospiraceae bacterium]|nr:DUF1015 domain-containing protein [Lachnospiraceae bacterium]